MTLTAESLRAIEALAQSTQGIEVLKPNEKKILLTALDSVTKGLEEEGTETHSAASVEKAHVILVDLQGRMRLHAQGMGPLPESGAMDATIAHLGDPEAQIIQAKAGSLLEKIRAGKKEAPCSLSSETETLAFSAAPDAFRHVYQEATKGLIEDQQAEPKQSILAQKSVTTLSLGGAEGEPVASPEALMVSQKVADAAAPFFKSRAEDRNNAREVLAQTVRGIEAVELDTAALVLCSSPEREAIVQALKDTPPDTEPLHIALMKALSAVQGKDVDILLGVIQKLNPPLAPMSGLTSDIDVHRMALIFGDSFLRDSGLEGESSSMPFFRLTNAFIASKGSLPPDSPLAKMNTASAHVVDLRVRGGVSTEDTLKKITDTVTAEGSCLLSGGWLKHAILYEIVKQLDGNYEFRIYNEGEGIQYHEGVTIDYKTKTEGCKVVRDIPEALLFRPSLIVNLEALFSMTAPDKGVTTERMGPDRFLYEHVLPMLDGKEGTIDPDMHRELSPQRSGTCTYRCIQAWAAYHMTPEEYTRFKYEFRQFLLDSFLPKFQSGAGAPIQTEAEYTERTKEYAAIKRSLEKFARSIDKHEEILTPAERRRTQKTILEFQMALRQAEQKLLAFEKMTYLNDSETVTKKPQALFSPGSDLGVDAVPQIAFSPYAVVSFSLPLGAACSYLLEEIRRIPRASDSLFSEKVESALASMAIRRADLGENEFFFVFHELFRAIGGTMGALKGVRFLDPQVAFRNFLQLMSVAEGYLQPYDQIAEHLLTFLALQYGMESAFRQIPEEERIVQKEFPTVLASQGIKEGIYQLSCSDPLWVAFKKEIFELPNDENNPFSGIDLTSSQDKFEYRMDALVPHLKRWYEKCVPESTKNKIKKSISDDREKQASVIIRQKSEYAIRLSALQVEVARLERLQSELHAKISSVPDIKTEGELEKVRAELAAKRDEYACVGQEENSIVRTVEHDSQYWPKGVEEDTDLRLRFIFTNPSGFLKTKIGTDDLIFHPEPLLQLQYSSVLSRNIFKRMTCDKALSFEKRRIDLEWDFAESKCTVLNRTKGSFSYIEPKNFNACFRWSSVGTNEQKLICETYSEGEVPRTTNRYLRLQDFPEDEERAILQLRSAPHMQISSTLDYFRAHVDKFEKRDWLLILYANIFDDALLFGALQDVAKRDFLVSQLRTFFESAIQVCQSTERIGAAANLFWMASCVQQQIDAVYEKEGRIDPRIERIGAAENLFWTASSVPQETAAVSEKEGRPTPPIIVSPNLIISLIDKGLEARFQPQQAILFESIAASSARFLKKTPEHMTEEEKKVMAYALFARLMQKKTASSHTDMIYQRYTDANQFGLELKRYISILPSDSPHLLALMNSYIKPLLDTVFPNVAAGSEFIGEGNDIFEVAGMMELSLSSGYIATTLGRESVREKPLTQAQRELLQKHKLFSDTDELTNIRGYDRRVELTVPLSEMQETDGFYCTDHKKKISYLIASRASHSGEEVYVLFNPPGGGSATWTKVLPEEKRSYVGSNLTLKQNYIHLQTKDGTIFLCDPVTMEAKYVVDLPAEGWDYVIRTIEHEGRESLRCSSLLQRDTLFSSFEAREYTTCWADTSGLLQRIEFSRYNLTFERDSADKWMVGGQKEWYLAREQFVPHLRQKTGFLVLENDKGEKKVFLPVWGSKTPSDKKRSLNFPYEYDFKIEEKKAHYVECAIKGDTLVPKSYEGRFYLARIYLEKGYVDESEALLFSHFAESTHTKLQPEEISQLENIAFQSISGDIGSRTLRLRMRALALLEKNKLQFPEQEKRLTGQEEQRKKEERSKKLLLMRDYFTRMAHLAPIRAEDELVVCKVLRGGDMEGSFIQKRIIELESMQPDSIPEERKAISPAALDIATQLKKEFASEEIREFLAQADAILQRPLSAVESANRMKYQLERSQGRFPFDYKNVLEKDLIEYFPFLMREAHDSTYENARTSGLLPVLYHMAFFHLSDAVKAMAQKCLRLMKDEPSAMALGQVRAISSMPLSHSRVSVHHILEGVQDLLSLNGLEHNQEEATLLGSLVHGEAPRLMKTTSLRQRTAGVATLFSPESVEIGADPTIGKQFDKMTRDLRRAEESARDEVVYSVNAQTAGANLELLEEELRTNLDHESTTLFDLERTILGSLSSALLADPVSHMQFVAGKRTLPTIEELCIMATRRDCREALKRVYPEISEDGLSILKRSIREYLIQKQYVQQIGRVIDLIGKIQNEREENTKNILINDLGKLLETKRAYSFDEEYADVYLFMETVLNIKLRPDQIQNISKLAQKAMKGEPVVLQMIMGAGKTSVLQPVLGYLFSLLTTVGMKNILSTVLLPESLFGKVKEELFKALGSAFHQFLFVLPYDRELAKQPDYLLHYEKKLNDAQKLGACLLMTPKEKHSILTSLYEAYYDLQKSPNDQLCMDRVNTISRICQFLHMHEADQVDEIDLVQNPNVIFKYPIGARTLVDETRASVLSDILIGLATDYAFNQKVSLDFASNYRKRCGLSDRGSYVTGELFETTVKPALLEKTMASLSAHITHFNDRIRGNEEYIQSFLTQKTLSSAEAHMRNEWIEKTFSDDEREILGAASHVLCNILPDSLLKECASHYGQDKKKGRYVAVPYEAPGAPKSTKYADPYQQVVFSTQLALYNGIPLDAAKFMLQEVQKKVQEAIKIGLSWNEIEEVQLFTDIMKSAPSDISKFELLEEPLTDEHILAFQKMASRNPKAIQLFLHEYVYSQVTIFTESLSSTPQALLGSSHYACGYTGTMHEGVLPKDMEGIPEEGTDGKTIAAIERKMSEGTSEIKLLEESPMAEQVIDSFKADTSLYVYIDSGGLLKEEKMQEFCEKMLREVSQTRPEIQAVVFLNDEDEGKPWIVEKTASGGILVRPLRESQHDTTKGSVVTVMAQKYETGTNIPQKPDAKAMISIRKNMTLRDGLQSVFRMRQILSGQNVCFALTPEVRQHISLGSKSSAIGSETLWKYMNVNQARLEQEKNWLSGQQRMREVVEKPFRQVLHDSTIPLCDRLELFKQLQTSFIESTPDSPYSRMKQGQEFLSAQQAIDRKIAFFLNIYKSLDASSLSPAVRDAILNRINAAYPPQAGERPEDVVARLENRLKECVKAEDIPPVIAMTAKDSGEVEEEQEAEEEAEHEIEQELEVAQYTINFEIEDKSYHPLFNNLEDFFEGTHHSKESGLHRVLPPFVQPVLGDHVRNMSYSSNLFIDNEELGSLNHGLYHLDARYMLIVEDGISHKKRFVMVSGEDADQITTKMKGRGPLLQGTLTLMTLSGTVVDSTAPIIGAALSDAPLDAPLDDLEVRKALLIGKLCAGKVSFSQQEVDALEKELLPETAPDQLGMRLKLRRFFENIVKFLPSAVQSYRGSCIRKMLSKSLPPSVVIAKEAAAILEKITDPESRVVFSETLSNISLRDRHFVDKAMKAAEGITDASRGALFLSELSMALLELGHTDRVEDLIDKARKIAETISDPAERAKRLLTIGSIRYVQKESYDGRFEIVDGIQVMADVSDVGKKNALIDQVLQIAGNITPIRLKLDLLSNCARTFLSQKDVEGALRLIKGYSTDTMEQEEMLGSVLSDRFEIRMIDLYLHHEGAKKIIEEEIKLVESHLRSDPAFRAAFFLALKKYPNFIEVVQEDPAFIEWRSDV